MSTSDGRGSCQHGHLATGSPAPQPGGERRTEASDDGDGTAIAISTFGLRIGVSVEDPILLDEAIRRLPPGWEHTDLDGLDMEVRLERARESGSDEPGYQLRVDGDVQVAGVDGPSALDRFENAIQYYVAEFADPWLFVHAGVVAWQGEAIVLPGRSFAGKSTLVAALVEAGASYYSDEYAVFDTEGRVWPYRRRLSLREGPFGPARRVDHVVAPLEGPLPVGTVALLKFDAEAGWKVEPLTTAQAVMGLCDNTVAIQRRPKDTLEVLSRVVDSSAFVRGTRGEVDGAVDWLLSPKRSTEVSSGNLP